MRSLPRMALIKAVLRALWFAVLAYLLLRCLKDQLARGMYLWPLPRGRPIAREKIPMSFLVVRVLDAIFVEAPSVPPCMR